MATRGGFTKSIYLIIYFPPLNLLMNQQTPLLDALIIKTENLGFDVCWKETSITFGYIPNDFIVLPIKNCKYEFACSQDINLPLSGKRIKT